MNITSIKVMTDYGCYPLWYRGDGMVGEINPKSLSISKSLENSLFLWAAEYDSILNHESPQDSGFKSREAELAFNQLGLKLAIQLQSELTDVEVYYFDSEKGCESHI